LSLWQELGVIKDTDNENNSLVCVHYYALGLKKDTKLHSSYIGFQKKIR